MIIVKKGKNEKIESMLKRYKTKVKSTQLINEYRDNLEYTKPSEKKREIKKKAIFRRKKSLEESEE